MNSKKILLSVNILLSGLILWTGANILLTWKAGGSGAVPRQEGVSKEQAKAGRPSGAEKRMSDYQAIISQDMFRSTRQIPGATAVKEEEVKIEPTRLNLTLKGVVVTGTSRSLAVIMDGATRKEDIYYVNDILQNAKIVRIQHDQVILSVNDRLEALLLFTDGDEAQRGGAPQQAAGPAGRQPVRGAAAVPVRPQMPVRPGR